MCFNMDEGEVHLYLIQLTFTSLSSNWTIVLISTSISYNKLHSATPRKRTCLAPSWCTPNPILNLLAFRTLKSISYRFLSFHSKHVSTWVKEEVRLCAITPKLVLDSFTLHITLVVMKEPYRSYANIYKKCTSHVFFVCSWPYGGKRNSIVCPSKNESHALAWTVCTRYLSKLTCTLRTLICYCTWQNPRPICVSRQFQIAH